MREQLVEVRRELIHTWKHILSENILRAHAKIGVIIGPTHITSRGQFKATISKRGAYAARGARYAAAAAGATAPAPPADRGGVTARRPRGDSLCEYV